MASPLKVGIAGLGTVGASVVRLIAEQRQALTLRCGRPIEVVAVSARSRGKDRGIDMKKLRWVADPVKLAADPGIDAFVELIGGEGGRGPRCGHRGAQGRQAGGHRQQGAPGTPRRSSLRRSPRSAAWR